MTALRDTPPRIGPFDASLIASLAREHGTPLWLYDAGVIQRQAARLAKFDVVRFAQKASSNVHVLRLLRDAGVAIDAVSPGELERAVVAGFHETNDPDAIVYTADLLDPPTLRRVVELNVPVNAGSIDMLEQLGSAHRGHRVWLRINPGFGHGHSQKTNTGGENSKHGIWHADLDAALEVVDRYDLSLIGLHMHIGSGVDYLHLERVCDAMVEHVRRSGRDVEAISAGGGLSIPNAPGDVEVDTDRYFSVWDAARRKLEIELGHPVKLEIEPGRFLVAEAGVLVSEVRADKRSGRNRFVLVDAGFNDLMRPAMYGAAHPVSFVTADGALREGLRRPTVVAGPLCESGDVFTQTGGGVVSAIEAPPVTIGDLAVFGNAGAYGSSMSSNYNSRPLAPEVLVHDGSAKLIRRRQTIAELIALED